MERFRVNAIPDGDTCTLILSTGGGLRTAKPQRRSHQDGPAPLPV
jgi:hypothetical protein